MKKNSIIKWSLCLLLTGMFIPGTLKAQDKHEHKEKKEMDDKREKMEMDAKESKASFIKSDNSMENLFKTAYGYAIFPNIGKAAVGVGGAGGKGLVYEGGKAVGKAKMVQVTVGAQVGGQAYREIIFFETKEAFQRFKEDKLEFSGQVSAVAAKSGASATAKYTDGVLVFTEERGGLMVEASVGGQKFTYHPFNEK